VSRRLRIGLFVVSGLGLGALFAWAFAGLPAFGDYRGPYGHLLNHIATPERHTTNVVAATVFDYRGFDTLGEEFILFAAVTGVVLLLREGARPEQAARASSHTGVAAVRVVGSLAVGAGLVVGAWLAAFGYVTPGGGFQGGVAIASSLVLVYVASSFAAFAPFGRERALDPLEAAGAAGFGVIGVAALATGLAFLANLLGPGKVGTLLSGGSIPFLNWAAALEVTAALLVLFAEFLQEYIVPPARGGR
jgi:multicomponent Na+:H+ antiporter subunit B